MIACGGIDVLVHAVISILSLFLQITQFGLYITFITGEALFSLFLFFVTKSIAFIKQLSTCVHIMYEDFLYFLNDLQFSFSTLSDGLKLIFEYLLGLSICFKNYMFNITDKIIGFINESYFVLHSSISQLLRFLDLLKDALLLIGSGIWSVFTYGIPVGFLNIIEFFCQFVNHCVCKIYSVVYLSAEYFSHNFRNTKFPYESIYGLIIGILFLYIIISYFTYISKFGNYLKRTVLTPALYLLINSSRRLWNLYFTNSNIYQYSIPNFFRINYVSDSLRRNYKSNSRSIKSPRKKSNLLKDSDSDDLCIICLDNKRDVILLPCRHFCMCLNCSDRFLNDNNNCPMCRQSIIEMLQVYY